MNSYTSPHLEYFHERINLGGAPIDEGVFERASRSAARPQTRKRRSLFRDYDRRRFCAFAETPADFLLLEVGLGGRLDATNVLRPELSVITPVSIDHQEFLGSTLEEIAAEKLGIVKAGVPVVSASQEAPLSRFSSRRRQPVTRTSRWAGATGRLILKKAAWCFRTHKDCWTCPHPPCPGCIRL